MKVDMKKAFDTLDWNFLLPVIYHFGFAAVFVDWILSVLHSTRLSILVNGKAAGFFSCSRGVRLGDPLSPLLFCLAEEVMSRALSLARNTWKIMPMSYCRGVTLPTHIFHADDVMIFRIGLKSNIRCLLSFFKDYSEVSGQIINNNKSCFYTGAMTHAREQILVDFLGFGAGSIPFTYLGCQVFKGKPKCAFFLQLQTKLRWSLQLGKVLCSRSWVGCSWLSLLFMVYSSIPFMFRCGQALFWNNYIVE